MHPSDNLVNPLQYIATSLRKSPGSYPGLFLAGGTSHLQRMYFDQEWLHVAWVFNSHESFGWSLDCSLGALVKAVSMKMNVVSLKRLRAFSWLEAEELDCGEVDSLAPCVSFAGD